MPESYVIGIPLLPKIPLWEFGKVASLWEFGKVASLSGCSCFYEWFNETETAAPAAQIESMLADSAQFDAAKESLAAIPPWKPT